MRRFAQLFAELDASTATQDKIAALKRYFAQAAPEDAAWALYFLAGGKPRQILKTADLRALSLEMSGYAAWLFEECYQAVGDLAETISLVLPTAQATSDLPLSLWISERLLGMRGQAPEEQRALLRSYFSELDQQGRFLLVKFIGGGFRVGVSRLLVTRALAEHAGLDAKRLAQRMMGYTDLRSIPSAAGFLALLSPDAKPKDGGQPYPFFLAHALDKPPEELGEVSDWQVEWKYDGIRAQLVKRCGQVWIWSRGEELVTERFPEIAAAGAGLADGTVLDGEILVWQDAAPAPFALLQQRIGRKTVSKTMLATLPVKFLAYDLLEIGGEDCRSVPQQQRRQKLQALGLEDQGFALSPLVEAPSWSALAQARAGARERGVEGLMLKACSAAYGVGRTKADGLWLKWKLDPMSVDCVLIYAQAGHGRRASVYTDYTFAVWSRKPKDQAEVNAVLDAISARKPAQPGALQLVSFAKAYSGLTDEEFKAVDAVIRKTTLEKFGPVRSVRPSLVFELGFEGINPSARHKSGIAVRFPRMLRQRKDKPLIEADSLESLQALMKL